MSALCARAQTWLDDGRPERAWDEAASAHRGGVLREQVYGHILLRSLAPRLPAAAWTGERAYLARSLDLQVPEPAHAVGSFAFPAVDSGSEGCFVEARVEVLATGEDQLLGRLDERTRLALTQALDAARAELHEPDRAFRLSFAPEVSWSGASAGLAVALAAVSAARGVPLSPFVCATGALRATGEVVMVGLVPEKLRLRQAARPRATMLVPLEDDPGYPSAVPVGTLAAALDHLGANRGADVVPFVRAARDRDDDGDAVGAARIALLLIEDPTLNVQLTDEERRGLLTLLLADANHRADHAAQERWSAELGHQAELLDPEEGAEGLARAIGSRVVSRVDALDSEGARDALALAEGRRWRRESRVHLDGPRALLCTLQGEHAVALALREQNLRHAHLDERLRCAVDLADALLRLDRPEEALARLEGAVRDRGARRGRYQELTGAFLQLQRARALAALGRIEEARLALREPLARPGLDPWLRASLLLAELGGDRRQVEVLRRSPRVPASSRLVGALLDRSAARLGDEAAADRLLALPPFVGLSLAEAARRLPY